MVRKGILKGAITVPLAATIASIITLGGWVASYYSNINNTNEKIAEVRQDVAVDKNQIQNLAEKVEAVDDDVQRLDEKMDQLLERFGVQYIEKRKDTETQTQMMTPLPVASNGLKNVQ